MIMIGPGTGIVPYIGFMEQREQLGQNGPSYLYFGCRKPDSDYIFKDKMEGAVEKGVLSELNVAFSRAENKEYVQDILRRHKDKLLPMIQ